MADHADLRPTVHRIQHGEQVGGVRVRPPVFGVRLARRLAALPEAAQIGRDQGEAGRPGAASLAPR